MAINAAIMRQVVREAEERVGSAYADLAMAERALAARNKRLRHYLRLGGLHWPSRVGWAQAVIVELERRVVLARSKLVTALAEYSAVRQA